MIDTEELRPGDTVLHRPSGEEWVLLRVKDGYIYPAGWPVSRARSEDCELVEKSDHHCLGSDCLCWGGKQND